MNAKSNSRIRLDHLLSRATDLSRKQAKIEIRKQRVSLQGQVVRDPSLLVDSDASIEWQGELLGLPASLYLMMHKPVGLVCARSDPMQATELDLLPEDIAERVHIVGRLDKDTTGLLLLTDDGAWSHRVSSPRRGCGKVYIAELAEDLVADAEQRFAGGMQLRSEKKTTRPAQLERLAPRLARVVLHEGRYHQVRRMFAALGNRVTALHRLSIGGLELDGQLQPGEWRELSDAEVAAVAVSMD
jgi:16S rRNA pseudouridine516 synthase